MPTCTVACKLPNGLRLRLHQWQETQEPVLGGGFRVSKIARPVGPEVVLSGYAHPFNQALTAPQVGGFALTYNVDLDFATEWFKQNAEHSAVKAGLVFMHEKNTMAEGRAKEHAKLKSGLEPIDPNNLPRGIQKAQAA